MQTLGHGDVCPPGPEAQHSANECREGSGCCHHGRLTTVRILCRRAEPEAPGPSASRRSGATLGAAGGAARGTLCLGLHGWHEATPDPHLPVPQRGKLTVLSACCVAGHLRTPRLPSGYLFASRLQPTAPPTRRAPTLRGSQANEGDAGNG